MNKRTIRLTESELKRLIQNIIEEQSLSTSFQQGKDSGLESGKQARQAVNQLATNTVKGMKQTVITIGKITFTIVIIAGVVIYFIGKAIYKVTQAINNAIIKFLSATGKAIIKNGIALTATTIQSLTAAGIVLSNGIKAVSQKITAMKDSSIAIAKWIINQFKQFGTKVWAKILVAAGGIKEFGGMISNYLKTSWASIQNQVGVAWDQASKWASGQFNNAVKTVQNTANKVSDAVSNAVSNTANKMASAAGTSLGAISGFLSEMYVRYLSFSNNTESILSEAVLYNGKVIL